VSPSEPILIYEADPDVREGLRDLLDWYGFTVVAVASDHEAAEEARAHPPAVALVDLQPYELAGSELLLTLREHRQQHRVPVLLLTSDPISRQECDSHGIDRALLMPVNVDVLLDFVRGAMGESAPAHHV
jgi:DNA-binding NarL/FixJ family response regulator